MKYSSSLLAVLFLFPGTINAQWVQTSLDTGWVTNFTVSDTNLFATTDDGVFRSTDNGIQWTNIVDWATDTERPGILLATGDTIFCAWSSVCPWPCSDRMEDDYSWVELSTDNGTSWNGWNLNPHYFLPSGVSALAAGGSSLLAGTYGGGVFLSTDLGTSWISVNSGLTNQSITGLVVSGTNLIAGTYGGGVFLSTDLGTSWSSVNSGLTNQHVTALAVQGANLLVGTFGGGVFLSTNDGTTWASASSGLTKNVSSLVMNGSYFFAGTYGGGVFLSSNTGASWVEFNTGLYGSIPDYCAIAISESFIFAGTSTAGAWRRPLTDTTGLQIITASAGAHGKLSPSGNISVPLAGTQRFLFLPDDALCSVDTVFVDGVVVDSTNGYTFDNITIPHAINVVFMTNPGLINVTSGSHGTVTPSGDVVVPYHGTQRFTFAPDSGYFLDTLFVDGVVVDSTEGYTFTNLDAAHSIHVVFTVYPTIGCVVREKWNLVSVPVVVMNSHANILYPTAISDAFAYDTGYISCDTVRNGVGYWLKYASEAIVPYSGKVILVDTIAVAQGWNLIGSISASVPVINITSDSTSVTTSNYYGYNGGYYAADTIYPGQGYWVKVNQEGKLILSAAGPASSTNRVKIQPTDEPPPEPPGGGAGRSNSMTPLSYELAQNYPNPFNPVTTIDYQLPVSGLVTLAVLDLLGREVERLVDGHQEAGYRSVTFDASRLASGVYFYKLTAGGFTATNKLLIMR